MRPKFNIDLAARLAGEKTIIVVLGCGPDKKDDRIGIDRLDLPGVDIVTDLELGLPFFPDHSVDEIQSNSILEHVNNFEALMKDIARILKPGGKHHIFVPHFSNPYYYSDYTHTNAFLGYTPFIIFRTPPHPFIEKFPISTPIVHFG